MASMLDHLGAFVPGPRVTLDGVPGGPLEGLTFAAKDNFDVAGHVSGCGNPDWLRTHEPAARTSWAVQRLLDQGANLAGKTQMDELAWGSLGTNAHYGTPINPAEPGRVPGGSSSGSASAVAGGLVDFALGTDSACSVRLPAAFCGLFGIRTTHGRVPLDGVVPLSGSLDTVGWFARDADTFARVSSALLGDEAAQPPFTRLVFPEDAFALAQPAVREALEPVVARLEQAVGPREPITLVPRGPERGIEWLWYRAWQLEAREAWALHGEWIESVKPDSRVLSRSNFAVAADSTREDDATAARIFHELREELRAAIPPGSLLCLPTVSALAPFRADPMAGYEAFGRPTMSLMSVASISGLPQVTIPGATVEGVSVGLSIIGLPTSDLALVDLAGQIR